MIMVSLDLHDLYEPIKASELLLFVKCICVHSQQSNVCPSADFNDLPLRIDCCSSCIPDNMMVSILAGTPSIPAELTLM
jgi:hypothetical protein